MKPIRAVETDQAPKAIGPYSQAVAAGPFLFLSGQVPIDPKTGKIIEGDIQEQTHRVIDNILAVLQAEGLNLQHVVRTEIYLRDLNDFAEMNAAYAERFTQAVKPARHAFQVAKLPLDARIEITCIALS